MIYRLLVQTDDKPGIIYKISKVLYENGLNILENNEFVDPENHKFYMRTVFDGDVSQLNFQNIIPNSEIKLTNTKIKKDIIILATKESHCLGDLLLRHDSGKFEANIVMVIANHENLRSLVERFDVPFICISHKEKSKEIYEKELKQQIEHINCDYIVLAKYMRILSPKFVESFQNKIINIHHSFLPAFVGSKPYQQAYNRGVKIIGATAHYVTQDLDQGPIIYQDVKPITHNMTVPQIMEMGRDVEKIVLAQALKLVFEDKTFIHNNKVIVL